ncbi:hypothetical protein KHF85_05870 [Xanthomonas translucens pv. graminis]|uniref:hypothetical protein n=1 Tax=Xanthomonas graminis TaxID=3390026 RepID=UPI0025419879|nr:hypothetical protein [Xanthomonas translucens]WIH05980.1 hypothetical protein KHF85_05870 [Xanthomonas translucens pv. graminis]
MVLTGTSRNASGRVAFALAAASAAQRMFASIDPAAPRMRAAANTPGRTHPTPLADADRSAAKAAAIGRRFARGARLRCTSP